jgi:hypothetical protein
MLLILGMQRFLAKQDTFIANVSFKLCAIERGSSFFHFTEKLAKTRLNIFQLLNLPTYYFPRQKYCACFETEICGKH